MTASRTYSIIDGSDGASAALTMQILWEWMKTDSTSNSWRFVAQSSAQFTDYRVGSKQVFVLFNPNE